MNCPIEVHCPWCGETFVSFYDVSSHDQSYVEDCQVCCRPITLSFQVDMESGEIIHGQERE